MCADDAVLQAPAKERDQSRKGSVLVEFALILPVFLLLLFGVITFSIALYDKTVLTMATREGARAGAKFVPNRTGAIITSSATAATRQACQHNLISFGPGMACTVPPPVIQDDILTVSASVSYTGVFIFSGLLISAETSMRLE
ncbi:MAG: pilus assembly protein [Chlorobiaceae bacterium]|nr:pilus assembly protein [Chlorobiaceae bacterium]